MVVKSKSPKETQKIAVQLAQMLRAPHSMPQAAVIALEGELGAGKTTFVKGFARALGIKEKISSPTFVILKKFEIRNSKPSTRAEHGAGPVPHRNEVSGAGFEKKLKNKNRNSKTVNWNLKTVISLYHIDAYRLHDYRDLLPLGIKEILADPANIVLIEWADRVRRILPKKYIRVHIDHINRNVRKILIT